MSLLFTIFLFMIKGIFLLFFGLLSLGVLDAIFTDTKKFFSFIKKKLKSKKSEKKPKKEASNKTHNYIPIDQLKVDAIDKSYLKNLFKDNFEYIFISFNKEYSEPFNFDGFKVIHWDDLKRYCSHQVNLNKDLFH